MPDTVKRHLSPREKPNQKFLSLQLRLRTGDLLPVFLIELQQFDKKFLFLCKCYLCEQGTHKRKADVCTRIHSHAGNAC